MAPSSPPASFSGIFKPPQDVPEAEYVLLGAPHDAGSTFRPGTRLGPRAIREMAESLSPCTERGEDLSHLAAVDAGDLTLPGGAPEAYARIGDAVGRTVDGGAVPIVLGGDHAVTAAAFPAVFARHPDLHLLYFDAHPDLYPEYNDDPYAHACVVHRILRLEGMAGGRVTQVGIRASNPMQRRVAEEHGIVTVHAWEVDGFAYEADGPVYVSVDIDSLDPAHAPGCGNPVPGGLSTRQLFDMIRALDVRVVGLDVVEVNPLLDTAGITALAAVRVVTEALGQMEASRGG